MARVLTLGPIALPTLMGPLTETLGDDLDTVGAGVVPGDRRPRPFPITIPIHGDVSDRSLSGTNFVTNPSFEIDTAGWATGGAFLAAGGTVTRSTAEATTGIASLQIVTTAINQGAFILIPSTFVVGVTYRVLARAKSSVADPFRIRIVTGTDSALQDITLTPGQWATFNFTFTQQAASGSPQLYVQSLGPTATRTVFVDAVCVGPNVTAYFDGDTPGYGWTGVPHASISTAISQDRFTTGMRLRRQIRALMENSQARLQGLYLAFSPDVEQNCWLLVGGGDLKYGQGSVALADFTLELTNVYRVANRRTHRPARRVDITDRRLITTPRDTLGTLFSTDFAATTPIAQHYLGVGVTDPESGGKPVATFTVSTKDGTLVAAQARLDGECISYEQGETDEYKAIVRLRDRRGSGVQADWHDVYGPDQPITAGEIPILDNAICRVVPDPATGQLDVQSWSGTAWVTDATVTPPAGATQFAGRVIEWTTERAVLQILSATASPQRVTTYVTLQRGWTGPRVETYQQDTTGAGVATSIGVFAKTAGTGTFLRSSGTVTIVNGTNHGTWTGLAPWGLLLGPGTDRAVWLAMLQQAVTATGALLSSRPGLTLSATGYVSVHIGDGPRATGGADAATAAQVQLYDQRAIPELVAR